MLTGYSEVDQKIEGTYKIKWAVTAFRGVLQQGINQKERTIVNDV